MWYDTNKKKGAEQMVTESARAKINLYLDVTRKRPDGYHELESVMQTVSLADTVTLEKADGISLICDNLSLPTDRRNLAVRAAEVFFMATGINGGPELRLCKRIPVAAGLAGGSADAAAVLRGLNRLYAAGLSNQRLCEIAGTLGADVPFCVTGGTMLTEGIGDRMTPVSRMPDCRFVVAKGKTGIVTASAYAALDSRFKDFTEREPRGIQPFLSRLKTGNIDTICKEMYNIFEEVVPPECEEVFELKRRLLDAGAVAAMMSGSGPSVFGIFRDGEAAGRAAEEFHRDGIFAEVCRPEA